MSGVPGYRGVPTRPWHLRDPVDWSEAEDFLRLFHAEHPQAGPVAPRLRQAYAEIADTGTYVHTSAELVFGARVAWRNSSRCIGRLYWNSLLVRDRRRSRSAQQICTDLIEHLRVSTGGARPGTGDGTRDGEEGGTGRRRGQLRPVITIFPQARPGRRYPRVWNEQLIRYAGYRMPDGRVVGDGAYVEFTAAMRRLGWIGKGTAFDVLPLAIETPWEGVRLFELPEDAVLEVPLAHPEHAWFAELDLRWHAVPAISNLRLSIGGVNYPLAPFSGWYMGTEVGSRNLADPDRYDLLPTVAARLGLDTSAESTLWRDRALVELNRAVLWSFERAGVRISDHHTESRRFMSHLDREARAGRQTPADWTWIVPPMSGAATPVFHRYYHEADQRPNFYLDQIARDLGRYGQVSPPPKGGTVLRAAVPSPAPPRPRPEGRAAAVDPAHAAQR